MCAKEESCGGFVLKYRIGMQDMCKKTQTYDIGEAYDQAVQLHKTLPKKTVVTIWVGSDE